MINHRPSYALKFIDPEVVSNLVKKREKFWNNLFTKYSKEFSESREVCIKSMRSVTKEETKLPLCEQIDLIQHWVNTGYLFGQTQNENSCPDNSVCLNEKIPLDHVRSSPIQKDFSTSVIMQHSDRNSSYSSVDTAAYILSNMNTTKKAEIVAIKEGAKCSPSKDCQKMGCTNEQVHSPAKQLFNTVDNNIALDNNHYGYQHSPQTRYPVDTEKNMIEKGIGALTPAAMLNKMIMQAIDRDNAEVDYYNSRFHPPIDAKGINSRTECDSLNIMSTIPGESCTPSGNFTSNTGRNTFHQKKLFTDRESPIDLVVPQCRISSYALKSNQSFHPAFSFIPHINKKKRRNKYSVFHETMINRLNKKQHINSERKIINRIKTSKNRNSIKSNNILNNTSIVNKSILRFTDDNHTVPIQKSCKKDRKLLISNNEPIVHIKRLSDLDIPKMKGTKATGTNVNPVVVLKRLSEDDTRKYMKLDSVTTIHKSNGNLVPQRTKLQSKTAIDIKETPDQYKFKRKWFSRRSRLKTRESEHLPLPQNIQLVHSSDTDTEHSLIIYKCKSDSFEISSMSSEKSNLNNNTSNTYNRNNMFLRKTSNINGVERSTNDLNIPELKMTKNPNCNEEQLSTNFDGKVLNRCVVLLEKLSERQLHKYNIRKSVECTVDYNKRTRSNTNYRVLRSNRENLNTEKNSVSRRVQNQSNINCLELCAPSPLTCKSLSTVDSDITDISQSVVRNSCNIDVQTQNVSSFSFLSSDEDDFMELVKKSQYEKRKRSDGTVLKETNNQRSEESSNVTDDENEDKSKRQYLRRSSRKRICTKSVNDETLSLVSKNYKPSLHIVEDNIFHKRTSRNFKNASENVINSSARNTPSVETRKNNRLLRESACYNLVKGSNVKTCRNKIINKNVEKLRQKGRHLYFQTGMFDSDSDATSLSLSHSIFSNK